MERYLAGEPIPSICSSLGRSRSWFYKWLDRYDPEDPRWSKSQSRRPLTSSQRTAQEIEEIVKVTRLSLYNQGLFCGGEAIHWELQEQAIKPLPSVRTINRILRRNDLTQRRTGRYEPKGVPYPELPAKVPNQRHQADFVGPRHIRGLEGPIRFYGVNVVDLATGRCGTQPVFNRSGNAVYEAFWAIWSRLGMPDHLQVDNEMAFYGTPAHPRGMGPLIRLCLHHAIDLWFIPPSEPWRNGVVEQFNHHYQQKFLDRVSMATEAELKEASLAFEYKHNSRYRYSKLKGQTPLKALAQFDNRPLRFPLSKAAPRTLLAKPQSGRYHLIRLIRGDCKLDVFSELFDVPPQLQYEYVVATVDVTEQKLKLFHNQTQVEEFNYKLR